jgi:transcriptional regulator of acetoin/glycerol metabolism
LYYRLNGLTVQLPALRERSDFAALTDQLLAELATEQGLPHPVHLAPALLQRLAVHPWPGNLRQYASVLRTACAMLAEGEDTLGWEHLGDDIVQALQTVAAPVSTGLSVGAPHASVQPLQGHGHAPALLSLQQLSSAAIDQALQSARGNVSQAARQLGISRQTLYRKLAARVH